MITTEGGFVGTFGKSFRYRTVQLHVFMASTSILMHNLLLTHTMIVSVQVFHYLPLLTGPVYYMLTDWISLARLRHP